MLREMEKAKGQLLRGSTLEPREEGTKTLTDLGISKGQSRRWQKAADGGRDTRFRAEEGRETRAPVGRRL